MIESAKASRKIVLFTAEAIEGFLKAKVLKVEPSTNGQAHTGDSLCHMPIEAARQEELTKPVMART